VKRGGSLSFLVGTVINDEDFHSVEVLETVVRQSEVLAHRKKWIFCKVTPYIYAMVHFVPFL
jgi:hypothetical protein